MKIGSIEFDKYPVFLSPMEDVTDPEFRLMCHHFGADLVYTEFVSSDSLLKNINNTLRKLTLSESERPVAIQIYGKEIDAMVAAAKIVEGAHPDIIDINFGCPVRKIASRGAGSGMLRDLPTMMAITREVVKAVNTPVTVKTRLGWDDDSKQIVDVAEMLQDEGAQAIAIHGRTRQQMYSGEADWTLIGEVKNNPRMTVPIIGNGDITTPQKAKQAFEKYGVDAVMVGRACIGAPWIFRDIKQYLKGNSVSPLSDLEKIEILKQQVLNNIKWLGEKRGILHSRRHLAITPLFKDLDEFKPIRTQLLRAPDEIQLMSTLMEIQQTYF